MGSAYFHEIRTVFYCGRLAGVSWWFIKTMATDTEGPWEMIGSYRWAILGTKEFPSRGDPEQENKKHRWQNGRLRAAPQPPPPSFRNPIEATSITPLARLRQASGTRRKASSYARNLCFIKPERDIFSGIKGIQGIERACNGVITPLAWQAVYRSMGERAIATAEDHTGYSLTFISLDFGH